MPSYTPQQRNAIAVFMETTGCKESAAGKQLKAANWDVNAAVDTYFQSHPAPPKPSSKPQINKLFDKYRDESDSPDQMGTDGTMTYLQDLGVSLEEPAMLAVLTQVKAPTMGELSRTEFVTGWEELSAETIQKQASMASKFRDSLKTDADFYRAVYRHSFILARQPGQKGVLIEAAVEFWRMLFSPAGLAWSTKEFDWVEIYLTFVQEKWNKSISKDLWDQTLFFARKTISDPTLAWWNEVDSAWPSILDEFAKHIKALPEHQQAFPSHAMDTS